MYGAATSDSIKHLHAKLMRGEWEEARNCLATHRAEVEATPLYVRAELLSWTYGIPCFTVNKKWGYDFDLMDEFLRMGAPIKEDRVRQSFGYYLFTFGEDDHLINTKKRILELLVRQMNKVGMDPGYSHNDIQATQAIKPTEKDFKGMEIELNQELTPARLDLMYFVMQTFKMDINTTHNQWFSKAIKIHWAGFALVKFFTRQRVYIDWEKKMPFEKAYKGQYITRRDWINMKVAKFPIEDYAKTKYLDFAAIQLMMTPPPPPGAASSSSSSKKQREDPDYDDLVGDLMEGEEEE